MKIIYICNDLGIPILGTAGSSIHIQEFINALNKFDISPVVLFQNRGSKDNNVPFIAEIEEIKKVLLIRNSISRKLGLDNIFKNYELSQALNKISCGKEIDIIHERYSIFSYKGADFAEQKGIPFILEINAPLIYEQMHYRVLKWAKLAERCEKKVVREASRIITVSSELKEYFSNYTNPDVIRVVPNGVNPDLFSPEIEPIWGNREKFTVGFLGSLKEWHGVENIVKAAKILKEMRKEILFLLVGDGPLKGRIESQIKSSGLESMFYFTGKVAHEDVPKYIKEMDIALAPYPRLSFFYYSPIKIFEYMSMAKPVIASSIGQINFIIRDGINGYLVEPGDHEGLAKKIKQLSQLGPQRLSEIGTNARETVLRNYTWKINAKKIISIYGEVI